MPSILTRMNHSINVPKIQHTPPVHFNANSSTYHDSIKIVHVNSQSIINKLNKIEILVYDENPHILCITESWCNNLNINTVQIQNYTIASYFVRQSHIHGGVLILVKNVLSYNVLKYVNVFSEENHVELCAISFSINCIKYCLINIYRPPNGLIEIFIDRLSQILVLCSRQFGKIILCGDLNINHLINSTQKDMLSDLLQRYNLKCQNVEPTRIFTNKNGVTSKAKIDYILTNISQEMYNETVKNLNIADHLANVISINVNYKSPLTNKKITFRNLCANNLSCLQNYLTTETFQPVYEHRNDIDGTFKAFLNILLYALELCCPTQSKTIIQPRNNKSWVSSKIVDMGRELKNLFWLKNNLYNEECENRYRKLKNDYKKEICSAKKMFYQNNFESKEPCLQQKYIWNLVKEKTGKTKNLNTITLSINDCLITQTNILANTFASYFSTATKSAIHSHFSNQMSTECTVTTINVSNTFFFSSVENCDVADAIRNLKNTNSMGIDCISTKVIKNICMHIAAPLAYIINLSVELGIFPENLKIGVVTPIFKKNDPLIIENYRGITVPTVLGKIVERVIYDKILSYLKKYKIISKCQNGFCPNKSTESAAFDFIEYVYKYIDQGKFVGALFFDLSRAFDSLDLKFMRTKLYSIGFRGNFLSWLMSYLEYRKIYVKINNETSDMHHIDLGVPQGSILGPLLFLIFINDVPLNVSTECAILYADDVTLAAAANDPEELQTHLNILASEFTSWCYKNALIVNSGKTVCMQFYSRKKINSPFQINVNDDIIKLSESTKFLGTFVDADMNWRSQLDHVSKKINSGFYALLQLRHIFDIKQLINIYYALIYPHLTYNIIVWGNANTANRIFISQKKIIRLLFSLRRMESCRPLFKQYNILTLPCIYIYKCIIYTVRNINNFERNSNTHGYPTRHGNFLKIPNHNSALYEKAPSYMGIKLFNSLPSVLKEEKNMVALKPKLKSYLASKCFYTVDEFVRDNPC